jgi:hypothetical protein
MKAGLRGGPVQVKCGGKPTTSIVIDADPPAVDLPLSLMLRADELVE